MKPRAFIASSVEHVDLAYAVQEGLEYDVESTVWSQGVFLPSRSTMASIIDQLDEADFAIFIMAPDDMTNMRTQTVSTVRDNVIFELGLFAGRLGHERCFMVVPRGNDDLHLPTDLIGLTPAAYDADRQDQNMVAALGPACNRIRKSMKQLGRLHAVPEMTAANASLASSVNETLCSDPDDCLTLIESWMGSRAAGDNTKAIRFDDVDRALKLVPGAARQHIKQAANKWDYVVEREGKDIILFKDKPRSRTYGGY